MEKQKIDDMRSQYEMAAKMEGHTQVHSVVVEGPADYENDPVLRQMGQEGWEVFGEDCFGQGSEMYTCVVYVRTLDQSLMATLDEGDYVKVLSNKPAFHILSCYGGMDITEEDVEPEEMVCIVNYVIDGTCCYVTTVSPNPGSNFVACQDEVICKVDPLTLTEGQRRVRLPEQLTAVNGFDNDSIPETAETYDRCVEVATRAVKAIFPEADLKEVKVMGESTFSHHGLIGSMDFFLRGIAAGRSMERKAELTQLYEEVMEYVSGRKFRDFYEARALIGDSCWMIPVSYDFRKAFVCRDVDERTRFLRYLGGEYQDAAHAVDHFRDECCRD